MFQCPFKTDRQWFANFWPPKTAKLLITEVSGYSHPWIKHIETRNASFLASFGSDLGICVAPKKQPKKPKKGPFQTESRLPTTIFSWEILVFGGVHNIMMIVFLSPKKNLPSTSNRRNWRYLEPQNIRLKHQTSGGFWMSRVVNQPPWKLTWQRKFHHLKMYIL